MIPPLRRIVADLGHGRVKLECGHQLATMGDHHRRRRCVACAIIKRRELSASLARMQERARQSRRAEA